MPGGPGIRVGENAAESLARFPASFNAAGAVLEVDVSPDVLAWSHGEPNHGWAFLPTGTNGTWITSMESLADPHPTLAIIAGDGPALEAGDADQDLDFDQLDLVKVQIASRYLTGQPATWGEGDWNGAPGGSPGDPPRGDGVFNQLDIIAAVTAENYLSGPYAADGIPAAAIASAAHTSPAPDLSISDDLGGVNSFAGGGDLGNIRSASVPVPEPSTALLLGVSLLLLVGRRRWGPACTALARYDGGCGSPDPEVVWRWRSE